MSNEVMVKNETQLAVDALPALDSGVDATSFKPPMVHLMQNTSGLVGEGAAKLGDIVDLNDRTVLGGFDKPVEIVPLYSFKTWTIKGLSTGMQKFKRVEPFTAENSGRKYEGIDTDGEAVKYYLTHNVYVLLRHELAAGTAYPRLMAFASSSFKAGEKLNSQIYVQQMTTGKGFSKSAIIGAHKDKKEGTQNYFAFYTFTGGSKLTSEEMLVAYEMAAGISKSAAKYKDGAVSAVSDTAKEAEVVKSAPSVQKSDEEDIY